MKGQKGFTLIELVMVIVILGILGAVATPIFIDQSGNALAAAKRGMSGGVKAAHAVAIADLQGFPDITTLETYVQAEGTNAIGTGIEVDINGTTYTVPTYTDTACSTATGAVGDTVRCVGTIP